MSTPIQTFYPKIEPSIPYDVQRHLQLIYSKLNNHALAFQHVKQTTDTIKETVITASAGGGSITASGVASFNGFTGAVSFYPFLGVVNNQTGVTTYETQVTDNGALIQLSDAAGVAVTLNNSVPVPWFALIDNSGTGVVTLTPSSGLINGGASATIPAPGWAEIYFDGTNYEALISATVTGSKNLSINAQTATYVVVSTDNGAIVQMNSASATTVTLPVTFAAGFNLWIKNVGAGTCTVQASTGNIDAHATIALAQWLALQVYWDGTIWHQLSQSFTA